MKMWFPLLLLAALLAVACNPSGDGGADYYISFLLDGERVELTEGLVELANAAPFATYAEGYGGTMILALLQAGSLEKEPDTFAIIMLGGPLETGTYSVDEEATFAYLSAGKYYDCLSGSFTVTAAGAVGGTVEGTFSGEVSDEHEETHSVTDGTFRVKRIADGSRPIL